MGLEESYRLPHDGYSDKAQSLNSMRAVRDSPSQKFSDVTHPLCSAAAEVPRDEMTSRRARPPTVNIHPVAIDTLRRSRRRVENLPLIQSAAVPLFRDVFARFPVEGPAVVIVCFQYRQRSYATTLRAALDHATCRTRPHDHATCGV